MKTLPYFAPLLVVAAHIDNQQDSASEAIKHLGFFRNLAPIAPSQRESAANHLLAMDNAALVLENADGMPAGMLVRCAAQSIEQGLRGLLYTLDHFDPKQLPALLKETGRLVVNNAFPRPLSCYATGPVGDFSVHRLPLAAYKPGLHIASQDIETQAALSEALRQARTQRAMDERQLVQDNPNTAIRSTATGQPLTKFTEAHWLQLTWRLGTTSVFNLLLTAGQRAATDTNIAPAPAELHAALLTIVRYCQQVFTAYLTRGTAYEVVGKAFFVAPQQAIA